MQPPLDIAANLLVPGSSSRAGTSRRVAGPEPYHVFIPKPLPPSPPIQMDPAMLDLLGRADRALGRLDGSISHLADPNLFLYMYIRKEAVLSSQIEGTQSSISQLLLFENDVAPGVPLDDVTEVSNYVAAMSHGLQRLQGGFPLSLRLLREIHAKLLAGTRGSDKTPGEFRTSQNWVHGSRPATALYVPPPPHEMMSGLDNLEKFLHDQCGHFPILIKAGMAHAQFETIHPFLDGNGRLGRLLITFLLCADRILRDPLLYLSLYLKRNRGEYYESMQRVRTHGDWEGWLTFYLRGVEEVSAKAAETLQRIATMFRTDQDRIHSIGRRSAMPLRLHEVFQRRAFASIPGAARMLRVTQPTVTKAIEHLERLGIIREVTGKRRDRLYTYSSYVTILEEGTEPIQEGNPPPSREARVGT